MATTTSFAIVMGNKKTNMFLHFPTKAIIKAKGKGASEPSIKPLSKLAVNGQPHH